MTPPHTKTRDRAPTIRDVARRAQVGVATVSRVLNDSPQVSDQARSRVRQTIDELGYRRSSAARNLALGRTQTIGVVAPFFTTPSVLERLRGVVGALRQRGEYDLMLFDVETVGQRDDAFANFARGDRIDGLLIMSLRPSAADMQGLRAERLPVVLVDVDHPAFPRVVIDDVLGGELATQHLIAKGHHRIGFVGDGPTPLRFTSSELRRRGMRRALRRAGIEPHRGMEVRGPHGREAAREMALRLLRRRDPPSAIFAASDVQAMGVLEAADVLGVPVPDRLAVIGFDDIEVAAPLGLSTVRQPLRETGVRGAEMLLAAIDAAGAEVVRELAMLTVVERRTT